MKSEKRYAITPTRKQDYAEWYQSVIVAADLAELSGVRGCIVIKPWGYAIWELIHNELDRMLKETGHRNAYFPMLIPKSCFDREAEHIAGFAKECAIVTHTRLEQNKTGELVPASPLEEPLIVRPTSETIIGQSFARWIRSYRDLPLLINQWANVIRWEMRPRIFLRTTEFLWQEGHTAHATEAEAHDEVVKILEVYRILAEEIMAMPVICGEKSAAERFPGAVNSLTIEAMMQDGKALQAGTSHLLGQTFSRACNIKFADKDGIEKFAWTTSWGVSTRLIGGLIMTHSDDNGLILPPRLAPIQVVILPILRCDGGDGVVLSAAESLCEILKNKQFHGKQLRVHIDKRDLRGGEKKWEYIKKGVPIRIEIGSRDIESEQVTYTVRTDDNICTMQTQKFVNDAIQILEDMQKELFTRALQNRRGRTVRVTTMNEFSEFFNGGNGFVEAYFCGDEAIEKRIKEKFSVTTRCMPLVSRCDVGQCFAESSRAGKLTIWGRAY